MPDPSILLLLTCVTCAEGTESLPLNSADRSLIQKESDRQLGDKLLNCASSVSSPEMIPASLETGFETVAALQTASTTAVSPRPTPPEAFVEPLTTASYAQAKIQVSTSPDSTPNSSDSLPALLKLGSRGAAVSRLQEGLRQLGYYTGEIDGIYGRLTFAAVSTLQQTEGLGVDGVAGSITLSRLRTLIATPPAIGEPASGLGDGTGTETETESAPASTTGATSDATEESIDAEQPNETSEAGRAELVEAGAAETASSHSGNQSRAEDSVEEATEPSSELTSESPDFLFDNSPSGGPFYLWISAWAIVYAGGMLFIFRSSISNKLGLKWSQPAHNDEFLDQAQIPLAEQLSAVDSFTHSTHSTHSQTAQSSDAVQSSDPANVVARRSNRQKDDLVSQSDQSLHVVKNSENIPLPNPSQVDTKPANKPVSKVARRPLLADYKLAYESFADQALVPVWANGGVVEPVKGLFSDLLPFGDSLQERRRNRAIAKSENRASETAKPLTQSANSNGASTTLIAVLPASDPETASPYTYELLDNAKEYFVLKGNELRIYDEVLGEIESSVDHAIALRRTDAEGSRVDKSFVVSLAKAEDDNSELPHSA